MTGGRRDLNYMANPSLFINRDPSVGFLSALEFGRVSDGQRPSCWRPLDENFAYFVPERARRPRGFHVIDLDEFDPWASEVEEIWSGPRFAAPLLGLTDASAGEVILAARAHFGDEPSINRVYFDAAMQLKGEEALEMWRCCLESGDSMAHFALGYTLYDLGQLPRGLRPPAPLRRARAVRELELVLARQGGRGDRRARRGGEGLPARARAHGPRRRRDRGRRAAGRASVAGPGGRRAGRRHPVLRRGNPLPKRKLQEAQFGQTHCSYSQGEP